MAVFSDLVRFEPLEAATTNVPGVRAPIAIIDVETAITATVIKQTLACSIVEYKRGMASELWETRCAKVGVENGETFTHRFQWLFRPYQHRACEGQTGTAHLGL